MVFQEVRGADPVIEFVSRGFRLRAGAAFRDPLDADQCRLQGSDRPISKDRATGENSWYPLDCMYGGSPVQCSENGYDAGVPPASAEKEQFGDIFQGK